jgi:hypothetical protein
MTSRALLAVAGVALLASLFLPWFSGGVSGWEHFAWTDVAFAIVAALLVVTVLRPTGILRVVAAVSCALGASVVLGHGFAPDQPAGELLRIRPGGYVALAALMAGIVGSLAAWPRWGGALLLMAAAGGLVGSLFSGWGLDEGLFVARPDGSFEGGDDVYANGFERWRVLDVAFLALAAGLLAAAAGRLAALARAVLAVAALAAAVCVVIGVRDQFWVDEGFALGAAKGSVVALLALTAALAGLALVRPRGPAARAG